MLLAEFTELCQKYWADHRGEVSAVYLRENSFDELYEDILAKRSGRISIVHPHWNLLHPLTRNEIKIHTHSGADHDLVLVKYGGMMKSEKIYGIQRS